MKLVHSIVTEERKDNMRSFLIITIFYVIRCLGVQGIVPYFLETPDFIFLFWFLAGGVLALIQDFKELLS